jgi:proteic killer suppression protein
MSEGAMDVEFADPDLDRLETDPRFTGGWSPAIVKGFRKAMQAVRSALDERDLYRSRGLGYEKLKGARAHQCSMRLNKQWRLILELEARGNRTAIRIMGIEDYH